MARSVGQVVMAESYSRRAYPELTHVVCSTWLYGSMGKSMRRAVEDGDDISTTKLMGKVDLAPLEVGGYVRRCIALDTKRDGLLLLVTMLANGEECWVLGCWRAGVLASSAP